METALSLSFYVLTYVCIYVCDSIFPSKSCLRENCNIKNLFNFTYIFEMKSGYIVKTVTLKSGF